MNRYNFLAISIAATLTLSAVAVQANVVIAANAKYKTELTPQKIAFSLRRIF